MGISIRTKTAILTALCTAAAASPASADTRTTSIGVNATVTANCTVSALPVEFPDVNTLSGSAVTGTGSVTVTCTNGTSWTAAADVGGGSGASFTSRRMTSGGNTLNYNLFTTGAFATVWGDGSGSSATIGNTGTGSAQTFTVHGRVPAGQITAPAGDYEDIVGITITY